jgi:exonuclease VII small subunit
MEMMRKVKEAVGLIKTCKSKITKAELEVKKVVDGFDSEEEDS